MYFWQIYNLSCQGDNEKENKGISDVLFSIEYINDLLLILLIQHQLN